MPNRKKFILSIDGGGIRGLIPARILSKLTEELRKLDKKKELYEYFDMIVGTSTGAIIAGGLSCPALEGGGQGAAMTPEQLELMFRDHGKNIFPPEVFNYLRAFPYSMWAPFAKERYPSEPLEELLIHKLGDANLKSALTNVVLTAYRLDIRKPVLLSNVEKLQSDYGVFRFRDAILASAAAPTYFQPEQISPLVANAVPQSMIDGGVFAGDPALIAYSEALSLGWKDFCILSLGTGIERRHYPFDEVKNWRVIDWINPGRGVPILNIIMQGQAEITDIVLSNILNGGKQKRYWKIDSRLDRVNDDLDDASDKNIARMLDFSDFVKGEFADILAEIAAQIEERGADDRLPN